MLSCKSFAIIITTKNRKNDLEFTLDKLISLGITAIPLYIIDDASDSEVLNLDKYNNQFSNIYFRRNSVSKGLIVNRNELARWAQEDILISLDDDSCFEETPQFEEIARRFDDDQQLVAVEFQNRELNQNKLEYEEDHSILQMYTGYGHAVHRARFLKVGGYREYFQHMCEERDFAQRAWLFGYRVKHCRVGKVLHRRSPVARIQSRNAFFLIRNTIIFSYLNLYEVRKFKLIFMPIAMLLTWPAARKMPLNAIRAIIAGYRVAWAHRDEKTRLCKEDAISYLALPLRGTIK